MKVKLCQLLLPEQLFMIRVGVFGIRAPLPRFRTFASFIPTKDLACLAFVRGRCAVVVVVSTGDPQSPFAQHKLVKMADNIFVYLGEEYEVPYSATHAIIDRSVKIIPRGAFRSRSVVSAETHDGIEKIEAYAFKGCTSLRGIKLPGVREVGHGALIYCRALTDVEFGDKLETIGQIAFNTCDSLRYIKMPSVRTIYGGAFGDCEQLTDVEFGVKLERIGQFAFAFCPRLQRIVIPLKDNMFTLDNYHQQYTQFDRCENLTTVDIVGVEVIHKTIASLLLESWRNEMNQEIDRINQVLPNTPADEKTDAIRLWIRSVINRIKHYKSEHQILLKEAMTLLELALWKANLDENNAYSVPYQEGVRVTRGRIKRARKEKCITSGADIIIANVLPFLQLLE
jgi:hypothetical protein